MHQTPLDSIYEFSVIFHRTQSVYLLIFMSFRLYFDMKIQVQVHVTDTEPNFIILISIPPMNSLIV